MNLIEYKNYLAKWIKEQVAAANMDGVIVGISGGVDSAVVAAIAYEAFPKNSLGVIMPIGKMGQDLVDAQNVTRAIGIKTSCIDLSTSFNIFKENIDVANFLAIANIKPRLRMTTLYALAQEKKYLVLGTDNAAEWMLGYFTKHGDGGVDLLPIVHLTKREVTQLAKELHLPQNVYLKAPSAGLWANQTDEQELGFSYEEVDDFLDKKAIDEGTSNKIKDQIKKTEHKRNSVPVPKKFK